MWYCTISLYLLICVIIYPGAVRKTQKKVSSNWEVAKVASSANVPKASQSREAHADDFEYKNHVHSNPTKIKTNLDLWFRLRYRSAKYFQVWLFAYCLSNPSFRSLKRSLFLQCIFWTKTQGVLIIDRLILWDPSEIIDIAWHCHRTVYFSPSAIKQHHQTRLAPGISHGDAGCHGSSHASVLAWDLQPAIEKGECHVWDIRNHVVDPMGTWGNYRCWFVLP